MTALERMRRLLHSCVDLSQERSGASLRLLDQVLEEDRKGRDLPGDGLEEIRSECIRLGREAFLVGWVISVEGYAFLLESITCLFEAIQYRDCLINDLRQDSSAYQRGLEEGVQKCRDLLLENPDALLSSLLDKHPELIHPSEEVKP